MRLPGGRRPSGHIWLVAMLAAILAPILGGVKASAQIMDRAVYTYAAFDELELAPSTDERSIELDAQAWIGGDYNRLWAKLRAEHATRGGEGGIEGQLLVSRTVSAFWNAQAGLRLDHHYGGAENSSRVLLAIGLEGLAPYWFEVAAFVFVSQYGDVSARLEASYELLFTQRLILEPELELNVAIQDVPDFGVGSGLNDVELGARLRYEIVRELAPYLGITWLRRVGDTAEFGRALGADVSEGSLVLGLRVWY